MAKPNYKFEKNMKAQKQKQKQEEKRQRRLEKGKTSPENEDMPPEPQS